jgi:hypothetical protein
VWTGVAKTGSPAATLKVLRPDTPAMGGPAAPRAGGPATPADSAADGSGGGTPSHSVDSRELPGSSHAESQVSPPQSQLDSGSKAQRRTKEEVQKRNKEVGVPFGQWYQAQHCNKEVGVFFLVNRYSIGQWYQARTRNTELGVSFGQRNQAQKCIMDRGVFPGDV